MARSRKHNAVNADGFARAIKTLLEEYGEDVTTAVNNAVPKVAKETARKISERGKREWGSYNDGWVATDEAKTRTSTQWVVHNVDKYQLAHLLEFSHPLPQGGSTRGYDHITTPSQEAEDELIKAVKEALNDI